QFYHVETDGRFPYWVYSGQQDSGTAGTASRGDYGGLTFREWHPVGADERGWDVPDPADPEIIYGSGLGGSLIRFDNRTGQGTQISPVVETTYARRPTEVKNRYTWITPVAVSKKKPHALYFASQVLFRSTDRGQSWTEASPDLTGAVPGTPGCDGEVTLADARFRPDVDRDRVRPAPARVHDRRARGPGPQGTSVCRHRRGRVRLVRRRRPLAAAPGEPSDRLGRRPPGPRKRPRRGDERPGPLDPGRRDPAAADDA